MTASDASLENTEADRKCMGSEASPNESTRLSRKRRERIQKHLESALDSPDTLRACLGPVASDLLEMCHELKQALDENLALDADRSDRLRTLMPALQIYLKTVQQTERLARLDVRLEELAGKRAG
ncbi:MAG: hypothetical protein ACYTGL_00010 [Planctomycetota bacterium]